MGEERKEETEMHVQKVKPNKMDRIYIYICQHLNTQK
jgi:hypothetical protein